MPKIPLMFNYKVYLSFDIVFKSLTLRSYFILKYNLPLIFYFVHNFLIILYYITVCSLIHNCSIFIVILFVYFDFPDSTLITYKIKFVQI